MANKMISEKELHDDFLSAMIRSVEPMKVPPGFSDEVMNRIGLKTYVSELKPYTPPVWLKWGIPGVFIVCLVGLLGSGVAKEQAAAEPAASLLKNMSMTINSWFTGFNFEFKLPNLDLSGTVLWILAGGMVLTWSFVLLFRFLEKKERQ